MTTLYDSRGKKINLTELSKSIADPAPDTFGRNVFAMGSPATGLTPVRLAAILRDAGEANDGLAYLTLAQEMEERDPHYRSVLATRKMAVSGLPCLVAAATDDPQDVKMADFVTAVIEKPEFAELVEDMMDALGKGYSVCEILWNRDGAQWTPEQYKWRDPRFFRFDPTAGEECLLIDEIDPSKSTPLPAYKFIVHRPKLKSGLPLRSGLARVCAGIFMLKSFTLRDWAAFGERYGMPLRLGKYPKNTTQDEINKLFQAVTQMGTDPAAVISDTMAIEFVETAAGDGGEALFLKRCEFLDKQTSKAVIGQTMTADDGSSFAQAAVHNQVRGDILASDVKQANRTLNRQLVKPLIDLNFGPQAKYPCLELQVVEVEDLNAWSNRLNIAVRLGARVEQSFVADKLGYPVPDAGAEILTPIAGGGVAGSFGGNGASQPS